MKQSGARSAPGKFWGYFRSRSHKTKENAAIRRAKRAGIFWGVLGQEAIKTKGNEAIRRAKRAGKFNGVFMIKKQ